MSPQKRDLFVAVGLGVIVLAVLLSTSGDFGVTWDEAFPQFYSARLQAEWFSGFGRLDSPFSEETLARYFEAKKRRWDSGKNAWRYDRSDHPSLPKTVMAFSYLAFRKPLGIVRSLRVPNNLYYALFVGVLFYWTARRYSFWAGLIGALSAVAMPRPFGHANVAGLDLPILVFWFFSAIAYLGFIEKGGWRRLVLCAVVYALSACIKLHAFFFPVGFFLWAAWEWRKEIRRGRAKGLEGFARYWKPHLTAWFCMGVLAAILYFATQPALWHHPLRQMAVRINGYLQKAPTHPISLYYLSRTYWANTPWHYPLVMTLFTVPVGIFLLVSAQIVRMVIGKGNGADRLFAFSWFISIGLVLIPGAQAYDGVRLFLGSFGFLAVMAGRGAQYLGDVFTGRSDPMSPGSRSLRQAKRWGIQGALILWSIVSLYLVHPFELGYYGELAGGIRGAHDLGMETTYWCDSLSKGMLDDVNRLPPGLLRPLCMNYDVVYFYKNIGAIKPEIRIDREWEEDPDLTLEMAEEYSRETPVFDYHLLQCRQGMMGNPSRSLSGWAFYDGRQGRPITEVDKDGVPFFMLFGPARRP